ncbi:hypothetical protein LTR50_004655 [Elasticomyces elasticus]|nr:hypothetical protein LTR50_004655 [Elasticomyces elasticus]
MLATHRLPSTLCLRTFSTTCSRPAKSTKAKLRDLHADVPSYPFGPSLWFKQSNHGLYGGTRIQFGNNVSEETETKTRRKWRPNIKYKNLFSCALNRKIKVRVSTRVLRTIDKVGGLDEYLLGEKTARIRELGMEGWRLRWMIMQTPAVRKRFNEQRKALGLLVVEKTPTESAEEAAVMEARDGETFDLTGGQSGESMNEDDQDLSSGIVATETIDTPASRASSSVEEREGEILMDQHLDNQHQPAAETAGFEEQNQTRGSEKTDEVTVTEKEEQSVKDKPVQRSAKRKSKV